MAKMKGWKKVLIFPALVELERQIMTLQDAYDTLKASVDTLKTETAAALDRVSADVQFLKDQVAGGGSVTPDQFAGLASNIDAISATLKATDPVPDNPPVAPPA